MPPTRLLAFVLLFTSACISEVDRRRDVADDTSAPADTQPEDTVGDTLGPDTGDTPDTAQDTSDTLAPDTAADTADTLGPDTPDTPDTVGPPCLPTGCEAPGSGCELAPGWCFIDGACVSNGTAAADNTCRVCDPRTPLAYSAAAFGKECDDGIACTVDDLCVDGQCKGSAECPNAQALCARKECNLGTGTCDELVDEGFCLVDGVCFTRGQTNAGGCARCVPDIDQRSLVAGDRDEPTNSFLESIPLPDLPINDVTGWSSPYDASLSPAQDRDFYEFVYDTAVSFHRPVARISPLAGPHELDFCIFVECLSPTATPLELTVACDPNAAKVVENGKTGCCRVAAANRDLPVEATVFRAFCSDAEGPAQARATAYVTVKRKVPPLEPGCLGYRIERGMRLVTQ